MSRWSSWASAGRALSTQWRFLQNSAPKRPGWNPALQKTPPGLDSCPWRDDLRGVRVRFARSSMERMFPQCGKPMSGELWRRGPRSGERLTATWSRRSRNGFPHGARLRQGYGGQARPWGSEQPRAQRARLQRGEPPASRRGLAYNIQFRNLAAIAIFAREGFRSRLIRRIRPTPGLTHRVDGRARHSCRAGRLDRYMFRRFRCLRFFRVFGDSCVERIGEC